MSGSQRGPLAQGHVSLRPNAYRVLLRGDESGALELGADTSFTVEPSGTPLAVKRAETRDLAVRAIRALDFVTRQSGGRSARDSARRSRGGERHAVGGNGRAECAENYR